MTDTQKLLAEFVRSRSDAAFHGLVTRYVDAVYSTALRLVCGDTHRAQDVAQTVFLDLAQAARTLPADIKLGGWLHRDTCFVAATLMRGERRRESRERKAAEMDALQNHPDADFSLVAPLLDEAINQLDEADRTAILLRFFDKCDFHTVGRELGSSEDAARMRVTRALEKLEDFLKRRGVTTTAASLGVVLSANAVQAAPAGLAVTLSAAAGPVAATLTTRTTTPHKNNGMKALQKIVTAVTLGLAVGTGIFQAHHAARLRGQYQALQQQQAPMLEQIQRLQHERDDATNRLAGRTDDLARWKRDNLELLKLRAEVSRMRTSSQQPRASNVVYTVEGRLHYEAPRIGITHDMTFTVCVSNCLWSITVVPSKDPDLISKQVYDGRIMASSTHIPEKDIGASTIGNDSTLGIENRDTPNCMYPGVGTIWLAYASAGKFSLGTNGLLEPVWPLTGNLYRDKFKTPASWKTAPQAPFLPARVDYLFDPEAFDQALGRASTSTNSLTDWSSYTVTAFRNIGSFLLPEEFELSVYSPSKSTDEGRASLAYRYHGSLTAARESLPAGAFGYGFGVKTFVVDQRAVSPSTPAAFVRYIATTNTTIPETNDVQWLKAVDKANRTQILGELSSDANGNVKLVKP